MYAYAILKTAGTTLDLPATGIAFELQAIAAGSLSALVEPGLSLAAIEQLEEEALIQAVLCHDRVICEVFKQRSLLPLRFGTCFVSPEALVAHLLDRQEEYLQQLDRLAGKAEYCLKCLPRDAPAPAIPSEAKGKQYFLAKKQRYQTQQDFQAEQAQQWLSARQAIARDYPEAIVAAPQGTIQRVYILGDSRPEDAFLSDRVQNWQQACSHWEFHLGDPLPPYHFVTQMTG